jgi:hypothetical protein
MAEAAVEAAGQALLDAPLQAANNVPLLLAKIAEPAAHDKASSTISDVHHACVLTGR